MEKIENQKGIKEDDLSLFILEVLDSFPYARKILVLFPDYTRIDFTNKIAPKIINKFEDSIIHFLNACGTHRAMIGAEFNKKLGIDINEPRVKFINHNFSNPLNLATIGYIPKELVSSKTDEQLKEDINITINKLIFSNYDLIIAISGTLPHEASGYSGGLKIFLPGIAGSQVTDLFHWAAALVGIPKIIGKEDNYARDIINEVARIIFDNINVPLYSFNMVNIEIGSEAIPIGLYVDKGYEGFLNTYKQAANASSNVHIKYIEKPLEKVVQVIPSYYDEVWLAGKGSYKLQKPGVMTEGGELIIYGPHINCFHSNPQIESDIISVGYHCKEYFLNKLKKGVSASKNVVAHVINVTGPGTFDPLTNQEKLHFKISLATAISEEDCKRVGLGYRDPNTIKEYDYKSPTKLWIKEGGKYLFDIKRNELI